MLGPHLSLGIAQTVFYIPALALAILLFVRNGKYHPRMAWWPFITLSLFRLAAGIITIVLEQKLQEKKYQEDPDRVIGLIIAAIVLLNVGIVPLVIAALGQMRIVLMDNYSDNPRTTKIARALRFSYLAAIILLSTGGGLLSTNHKIGRALSFAGYGVFAADLAVLIAMEIYYLIRRNELIPSSRRVLLASLIAAPFLIVRTAYGILETVHDYDFTGEWSPLFGNVYTFAFMGLLMEYIVMWIYFILGFSLPADRGVQRLPQHEDGHPPKR